MVYRRLAEEKKLADNQKKRNTPICGKVALRAFIPGAYSSIIATLAHGLAPTGLKQACLDGVADAKNNRPERVGALFSDTALLGCYSTFVFANTAVICGNVLTFHGGNIIGRSQNYWETFQGIGYVLAGTCLALVTVGSNIFVAQPLIHDSVLQESYHTGYTSVNSTFNATEVPCVNDGLPESYFTSMNVISEILVPVSVAATTIFGLFKGLMQRNQPQPVEEKNHTRSSIRITIAD